MNAIDEVLKRHIEDLRRKGAVSFSTTASKIAKGVDTGIACLRIYVLEKKPLKALKVSEVIPPVLDGIPTDIMEWRPDWKIGKTKVGDLLPWEQKRLCGVRKDE